MNFVNLIYYGSDYRDINCNRVFYHTLIHSSKSEVIGKIKIHRQDCRIQ